MVVWIISMVSTWVVSTLVVGGWRFCLIGYCCISSSQGNFVGTTIIVMEDYLYLGILRKIIGYYYYP